LGILFGGKGEISKKNKKTPFRATKLLKMKVAASHNRFLKRQKSDLRSEVSTAFSEAQGRFGISRSLSRTPSSMLGRVTGGYEAPKTPWIINILNPKMDV